MSRVAKSTNQRKPVTAAEVIARLMPDGARVFLTSFANDRSEKGKYPTRDQVITNPDRLAEFITDNDKPGRASYFAVNPVLKNKRGKDHVAKIVALFIDIDFKGVVENRKTIEAVIAKLKLRPTITVFSGHGFHLYWSLKTPLAPEQTQSTEDIMRRICAALAGDTSAAEVSRVLRLPGSHNSKNGEWIEVEVIGKLSSWDSSYAVHELDRYFSELDPLLTYKPTASNVINIDERLNEYQRFAREMRKMSGGFDADELLDKMVFHDVQGHGIDDTMTKVVGAMVAAENTVEEVFRLFIPPMKRVYERDREAGEPAWNERRAMRDIKVKFNRFKKIDAKKPKAEMRDDDLPAPVVKSKTVKTDKSAETKHDFDFDPPERPVFNVAGGELSKLATDGEQALIRAREPIYQRGGALVRPIVSDVDAAHGRKTKICELKPLDIPYLRDQLMRVADWQRRDMRSKKLVPIDCPLDVAATILARSGHWRFPALAGVVTTQTMRPDGSLLTKRGYDEATGLLLVEPPELPDMPERPTKRDAETALAKLTALITEFPFTDDVAKAVALSGIITPVVRGAFSNSPMHVARSSTPGSGKSFLMDIPSGITSGFPMPVLSAGRTDDETEKRLGAALMGARPLVCIDNANGELGGDALCQIVERPIVEVRILGQSKLVRIEARGTTVFATGNNLIITGDLVRRVLISTLDAELERPELRKFKSNPVKTVLADRGAYIAACLTICRAYLLAGRPNKATPLGSFEGWSDTVRSALMWLGVADPVQSMELARDEDTRLTKHRDVLKTWHAHFQDQPVRLSEVIEAATVCDDERHPENVELHDAIDAVAGFRGPADTLKLSAWCRKSKGRIIEGLRLMIAEGNDKGGSLWRVEEKT